MHTIIIDKDRYSGPETIQSAINSLPEQKTGRIIIRNGSYLSNPLRLRSNLVFWIERGADIFFSNDLSLYSAVFTRWEGTECFAIQPMIYAEGCQNITLCGKGVIDGRGSKWWRAYREIREGKPPEELKPLIGKFLELNRNIKGGSGGGGRETGFLRPSLIQFKECSDIKIKNLTLQNSPFWNTHILYCCRVSLSSLNFINPPNAPNTDGLDIDSSSRITVRGCRFDVGDDCLCLKSGMDEDGLKQGKSSSDILIRNCVMSNGHGAVVIGSETSGGIRNIKVKNCRFTGTDRGIRIKTRRGRGGTVENIDIRKIRMNRVKTPLVLNMYYRCGGDPEEFSRLADTQAQPLDLTTPRIRNIKIRKIRAYEVSSSAAFLLGLPESRITGLSIADFKVEALYPNIRPDPAMDFFHSPATGPIILHANLENFRIRRIKIKKNKDEIMKEIEFPRESIC